MREQSTWKGTQKESAELAAAINRNCICRYDLDGERTLICPPHRMLADDQRALDGLLFFRQIAGHLRIEEFEAHRLTA